MNPSRESIVTAPIINTPPFIAFNVGISLRNIHDHIIENGISVIDTIAATPPETTLRENINMPKAKIPGKIVRYNTDNQASQSVTSILLNCPVVITMIHRQIAPQTNI